MPPVCRPTDFRRIALRSTGGKVKAIFWHLGVRCALEARGFTFTSGFGPRITPQPGEIGFLIGSSAGAIFSLLVAAGYDVPEILESFLGRKSPLPRNSNSTIIHRHRRALKRYVSGVPISRAAAASMAIPSVFNPVSVRISGRKHYFIDGDVYNPTETMVETDHGCDLAIMSSFEAPYRFHPAIGSLHHLGLPFEIAQTIALTIYSRFLHARNAARAKWAGLQAARDALAPHVDEETLARESKRIAAALEMSLEMKIIHLHPYKNPLLFFGNAFDLSPKSLGTLLVEASLQASDVLDREGFPMP